MKTRFIGLMIGIAGVCLSPAKAATPGPAANFNRDALWSNERVTSPDASGLATRGVLFIDMANEVGATDRLTEALKSQNEGYALTHQEVTELERLLVVSKVLSQHPDAIGLIRQWLQFDAVSPHRADISLLLADLLLENGLVADAKAAYQAIDIESLSPNLRCDYLYHRGYCDLKLADYAAARSFFENSELIESKEYGNAARFYLGYLYYVERDYDNALTSWDALNMDTLPGKMAGFYLSQIAYFDGRYDNALAYARKLVDETGVPPVFTAEANRIIGESLYQKGEPTQAIPYLLKYTDVVETPERSAMYILGLAQYEDGEYKSAVNSLTPVTDDKSAMGQSAYLYIGQALLKLGDENGAIMAFNRALNMDVDAAVTEVAYYNYAVARSRGGGVPFASSVSTFNDFLTRFPNSRFADDVAGYLVAGYMSDGNYEAALTYIDKIKNPTASTLKSKQNILYLLGAKQLAADNPALAVATLRDAEALAQYDPETGTETKLILGEAYYRNGNYDEAAGKLLEYIDITPASTTNHGIAVYDLGYTRMAQKDWSKAETNFSRLTANPGKLTNSVVADAQNRLGDSRYYQRNWSGAEQAYDAAYRLSPEEGDYPLYMKALMQGYNRRYDDKIATLNTLIGTFPTSAVIPDALLEKAEAYTQLKKPEQSQLVYRELIDKYSQTSQGRRAYLYLASGYAGQGKTDEAIATYQELIKRSGSSDEARLADEAVKRLHAERGSLSEYADFVNTIDGAPSLNVEESESLAWNAAEHAYLSGKGTQLLQKYVADYPKTNNTPRALAYLLDYSDEQGLEDDSYKWAAMLIDRFPDSSAIEQALLIKADIDYDRGRGADALRVWEKLEQKASTPENKNLARLGIMRVARDMADAKRMNAAADALLKSSNIGAAERTEALFSKALAASLDGDTDTAVEKWKELAENTDDLYGAKSAVYATEALNRTKRYAQAARIAETFVNSGTPHTYWLARGFIALSDAYKGSGRNFEAQEYLKALKENYPGNETDISQMIEERLN